MAYIGTAAWGIPKAVADRFPRDGSSLRRYAALLNGVEINSSFNRRHKPETWRRWSDSVPERFRFAVKMPKRVTHDLRLAAAEAEVELFVADVGALGNKLGPILIQLPPGLMFKATAAQAFFEHLRSVFAGRVVIEPRHQSWGTREASSLLRANGVTRVTADPVVIAIEPTEDAERFRYLRLHGSPKTYYSSYDHEEIARYCEQLDIASQGSWCIFDNTASGAALSNALAMRALHQPK